MSSVISPCQDSLRSLILRDRSFLTESVDEAGQPDGRALVHEIALGLGHELRDGVDDGLGAGAAGVVAILVVIVGVDVVVVVSVGQT